MSVPLKIGTTMRLARAAAAALLLCAGSAGAMSLQQAYDAALKNDPAYRMQFYENEFGKENRIIGRSALLPYVSASYSANKNRVDQTSHYNMYDTFEQPRYIGHSSAVQLRQPLFSLEAWARYRQGVAQSNQSAAAFEANTGEVALRVVGAYMDALFAEDQLALSKAQRDAYLELMKVNERLFAKGEGTRTDQLETQAKLDMAEAQLIEAQDNVIAARNSLEGVVGMEVTSLDRLGAEFDVKRSPHPSFEEARAIALERNPDLKAARFAVEVAQQEINKSRSGHTPRVDLIASYSKGNSESINTYNQDTVNRSIGVQVNIPLFAGGAVSASSRQAVANLERAKADLQGRTNKLLVELRRAHSLVESSGARLDALDKAVSSGQLLTKATEQSIRGGVRINLDLLNAQQQLVATQRDRAQARYSYLLGMLRLRAATGTFEPSAVREVGAYFH
jgi:protease secretion system outer membrane protein